MTSTALKQYYFLKEINQSCEVAQCDGLKSRLQFLIRSLTNPDAYRLLRGSDPQSPLAELVEQRPGVLNFILSPYIDARWSTSERVQKLVAHADVLKGNLRKYSFHPDYELPILNLESVEIDDFRINVDKPKWFFREGFVTANLFYKNIRAFSISFSFFCSENGLSVLIGGLQGRRIDGVLDLYRQFTKLSHGIRPRDFLVELLRMIARAEGVNQILAIPDQFRHQRHPYFSSKTDRELPLNYDEAWIDRGGVLNADGYFDLPLNGQRDFEAIPARKRSLYRKRFELLDKLDDLIAKRLAVVEPRYCKDDDIM